MREEWRFSLKTTEHLILHPEWSRRAGHKMSISHQGNIVRGHLYVFNAQLNHGEPEWQSAYRSLLCQAACTDRTATVGEIVGELPIALKGQTRSKEPLKCSAAIASCFESFPR